MSCYLCKFEKYNTFDEPCYTCDGENNFEAKECEGMECIDCYYHRGLVYCDYYKLTKRRCSKKSAWKSKECEDMNIKINRKVMTEQEQVKAFSELVCEIKNHVNKFNNTLNVNFVDRAMEICKNDPQEIESIEIPLTSEQRVQVICHNTIPLTLDQYRQIKAAVEGGK